METIIKNEIISPRGNWATAKDFFPLINVDQEKKVITITTYESEGRQKYASISTDALRVKMSLDKTQCLVKGLVNCKNWKHWECSKAQSFVFAIFVGDSGHIYIHRAPATKGWLELDPEKIRKRLIKLGIGATTGIIQQGDFILKPANGNSLPIDQFLHEWSSSSHHKFSEPLLSEYISRVGRIIYIPEGKSVKLVHEAIDGIQHPTVTVPAGQWIIGTTASSLRHSNRRD